MLLSSSDAPLGMHESHSAELLMVCRHVLEGTAQPEIHDPDDGERVCTPCWDMVEKKMAEFGQDEKKVQTWIRTPEGRQILMVCKACYLKQTGAKP
jgi:hypothetical protein